MEIKKLLRVHFLKDYIGVFKEYESQVALRKEGWNILFLYVLFDMRFNIIYSYYLSVRERYFLVKK